MERTAGVVQLQTEECSLFLRKRNTTSDLTSHATSLRGVVVVVVGRAVEPSSDGKNQVFSRSDMPRVGAMI